MNGIRERVLLHLQTYLLTIHVLGERGVGVARQALFIGRLGRFFRCSTNGRNNSGNPDQE
jgi:hypothetical protein